MTSVQVAMANSGGSGDTGGWDSDGSLSWEDFFGTSTDLVPTLLGMYDALVGRPSQPSTPAMEVPPAQAPPSTSAPGVLVSRPLSISSIASSSSSSSGTSSCSGRRLGTAPKSSAYLASIESLEDDDDSEDESRLKKPADRLLKTSGGGSGGSQGSGDSGVCSPCSYISSPCPPPGRPRYCDPHLSYMDRVVMEIIETEGVYVRDLHQVIEGYLEKWRNSSDCPLSDKQLTDLFSNIEDIYRFNSGFLQELEQCGLDPVRVAQCFVRNNAGFSIYTQYCTNYPRTVSILTELMRQEGTVRLFRERQTFLQHTLPLGSYLLKPVQRILKYHLLLQNIVKHYVYEAEGYSDIVEALSAMTGIAHHINDMKRRHEHAVRVQEIQSLLYGWEGEDLTTFGELCAEGTFRMHGAKALRHAFLFDRMLLITKKKEESILGYKTHIMCSNLMLIESVPGEPLSFHVIPFDNPRLQYTLQARNLEQKREWTLQLKRVILENYNAVIPSHARQLVMELGQNRTDDEIMAEKATPKRQHSAPEYLEKRKQERERRKSETGLRYRLRRSRKSDVGATEMTSPLASRRGRRASSSSRDRSQSREDTRRSTSPHTKLKDRFGSWRRKSEPGCYTIPSLRKSSSSKLSIPMEAKPNEKDNGSITSEDLSQCQADGGQEQDDTKSETEDELEKKEEAAEEEEEEEEEAKTLEEIVSQLVMQNREFQRILKKQQRHVNRHRHREETTDTENEEEGNDLYETLSRPIANSGQSYRAHRHAHMRSLRNEQKSLSSRTQQESEYVTLKCENVPDKPEDGFGNYDNLQLIWESVQKQQVEIQRLADDGSDLRRTRSFSCHLRGLPPSTSQASLDIPTLPAVWLKQQGEHLATPNKKSGSLPRSFQLSHEESPSSYRSRPLARDSRSTSDRPFTIASDKPPEINFEDIERYIEESDTCNVRHRFPINPGDTTEDESVTDYTNTPGTSLNELNIHPEYKIYRPSMSRASLRHVISSMSSKLRVSSETLDTGTEVGSHSGSDRRASRLVYELARQYSKTLKQRIRNIMGEDASTPAGPTEDYYDTVHSQRTPSPPVIPPPAPSPLPIYKQGSSSLGARIAHCSSEYANPRQLYSNIPPPHSQSDTRPDSVLSLSSNFTMSSSEGEKTSGIGGSVDTTVHHSSVTPQEDTHFSDGSADSYYERSFEAIENFLESEIFRDSAVFSDHEDSNEPVPKKVPPPPKPTRPKVPPPVPAKPDALKAKSIVNSQGFEGIKKSIQERRRELELWKANSRDDDTSSQHSTASTVIEVSPASTEEATDSNTASTPRGWVKHVIGKLQGSPSEESRLPPQ